MALDYIATSKKILDAVGGAGNIVSATNCMTRMRLVLADESKANDNQVKAIKGVKSVIKQGGQYQVVIGNEVSNLMKEFNKLGNFSEDGGGKAPVKAEGNPIQRLFGFVAGCLTPLLPAMLGTGMVKVLLVLLNTMGLLAASSVTYKVFFGMADSFFHCLPIMLGWSIAKKTNHSVPMYMVIGAALVYPDILTMLNPLGAGLDGVTYGTFLGQDCAYIFGAIPLIKAAYASSVLPMLLMTPIMGWAEDFADRVSPNVLKAFLKPMLFFLICTPIVFIVLGPLGAVVGNVLAAAMSVMYNTVPWLTVGLLSAAMPFIVMTGMHYALVPLSTLNLTNLGYDVIVIVTMFCSNICQGGASFGVAARTKDVDTKSEGIACGISACIAGVTEPAMYGINMRFGKPMVAAVCGAGVSGLLAGLTSVKGFVMGGSPSLMSLITFVGVDSATTITNPYHGVIWGAVCAVVGIGISFALSFILFNDKDAGFAGDVNNAAIDAAQAAMAGQDTPEKKAIPVNPVEIDSPLTGKLIALKDVPDEVFASGALGDGVAVLPTDGNVYAPCDAAVTQMMDSRHAIGLVADNGVEILIHVGLDTVEMGGKPFQYHVKEGQEVKKGDLLLTADLAAIEKAGHKLYTPIVITNSDEYTEIVPVAIANIKAGEKILTIK